MAGAVVGGVVTETIGVDDPGVGAARFADWSTRSRIATIAPMVTSTAAATAIIRTRKERDTPRSLSPTRVWRVTAAGRSGRRR